MIDVLALLIAAGTAAQGWWLEKADVPGGGAAARHLLPGDVSQRW